MLLKFLYFLLRLRKKTTKFSFCFPSLNKPHPLHFNLICVYRNVALCGEKLHLRYQILPISAWHWPRFACKQSLWKIIIVCVDEVKVFLVSSKEKSPRRHFEAICKVSPSRGFLSYQGRNWVILRGGRRYIYDRKDEIIHCLSPVGKCVAPLFKGVSSAKVWNAGGGARPQAVLSHNTPVHNVLKEIELEYLQTMRFSLSL